MPRRLHKASGESGITIVSSAASLPFPPLSSGDTSRWNKDSGVVPEFDIEIESDATSSLTGLKLHGGVLIALTVADDTFTADHTTETFTATSHGLETGDGPIRLTTTGTLPAGLTAGTDYYVIKVDANDFKLALTRAGALAGTVVEISDNGTGTHTLQDDPPNTQRLRWQTYGLLGQAEDGVVSLAADEDWVQRLRHRPRTVAYAISATTVSAGNITAKVYPAQGA